MPVPNTLLDIRNKVRRIVGRGNSTQILDSQIDDYINTFYIYDLPEHLHLIDLRVNYQFLTNANQPTYDFPKEFYLTNMPPCFIGGYQSYMTQSRENFFRVNPNLNFLQQSASTGNGTALGYYFNLTQTPVMKGWKRNPPGAYSVSVAGTTTDVPANTLNWNVLITSTDANGDSVALIDDGQGHLFDINDASTDPTVARGSVNYITGAVQIPIVPVSLLGFASAIPAGNPINAQYVPYVASRPQSVVYFGTQFVLYPCPDQCYTVSFEAYKYPTQLINDGDMPQLAEWWQLLAYGAADKIFADLGDMESLTKFRPLLEEQMKLVQRRTIVQQTSERAATIYTEQSQFPGYPFGNLFSGF
jgi:hypothetical protein